MRNKGFTLVELLVVIAVITILATALLVNVPGWLCRSRESASIMMISEIERTLEVYYRDFYCYPEDESSFSTKKLVIELKGDPMGNPPKKQYYPFKEGTITPAGEWLSPLKYPFYYRNNLDKGYGNKKPPPPEVHQSLIYKYEIWSRDCRTPEEMTSPLEIAKKTVICNWKER